MHGGGVGKGFSVFFSFSFLFFFAFPFFTASEQAVMCIDKLTKRSAPET